MTEATDDASRWSWIAPDGKVGTGSGRELGNALAGGGLPAGTFVWKKTWLEWLPASQVADLAALLPAGKAEPARVPRRAATALTPPFRPASAPQIPAAVELPRPPQAPKRAAPLIGEAKGDRNPNPAKEATDAKDDGRPSSFGVLGKPRGVSILGPRGDAATTTAPRGPLPTLGEDSLDTRGTLRPPGAVPPPPRMVQAPVLRLPAADEQLPTPRRISTLGVASSPRDTISDADLSEAPSLMPSEIRAAIVLPPAAAPTHSQAAPSAKAPIVPNFDTTLGSTPFEAQASIPIEVEPATLPPPRPADEAATLQPPPEPPVLAEAAPTAEAPPVAEVQPPSPPSSRPPAPRALLVGIVLLAGVVALLAAGMVALVSRRNRDAPVAATSGTASAPARVAAKPPTECRLLEPAARLTTAVHRGVPPLLAEVAKAERVAVGLAETPKGAVGLVVNLSTLDVERAHEQTTDKPLFGVVPIVASGGLTFAEDRADGTLAGVRTLASGLAVAVAGTALVRSGAGENQLLWAGAAVEKITDPRVASGPAGHLVTFRRGGLSGHVHYGWLEPDGKASGELGVLELPNVALVGTPDAAVSGEAGLIVFAGRPSPDAEWRVQLASVPKRGKPSVQSFETPPGGPGGGSIAPAASALGEQGWLLQWTEGTTGKYQVRGQRLARNLERVGEAWLVSPKGANAGQGALLASGARVLSVFVQTTAGHDELWGASFECP